jgi:hypothetical protein
LITIMAADEAVGGVGKTVFVQCPGQDNTGEHRQECCRPIPEAEQLGQQKSECRNTTDSGADQRESPGCIGEPPGAACRRHNRDPGEKSGRNSEPSEYPADDHASTITRPGKISSLFRLG